MPKHGIREGLALFGQGDVRKLFIAYLVTYTGTAMAPIALAFGVLDLTGSTRASGIVIAAPTIAMVLVILLGGAIADRTSRQRIMVGAEAVAMLTQLGIAYAFLSGGATVPILTALMLVSGCAMAFNAPAAVGLITQIVDPHELQAANALLGTARNAAMAGGAALGGILVATLGAGPTLLIDGLSFGLSALLVASLSPRIQSRPEPASIMKDLRLGFAEFTSHTWLWVIVSQFSLLVAVHESVFGLLGPAIAREQLNGAADWGFIAASFGVGTLGGGLISLKLHPRHPMRFGTLCTLTFSMLPFALATPVSVVALAVTAGVMGVSGQIFAVIWYTTLQQKIPGHMLSRVSAYDHLGSVALAPLGIVAAGFLFEAVGSRATLLIAGTTALLPTLAVLGVRDVWTMQRHS